MRHVVFGMLAASWTILASTAHAETGASAALFRAGRDAFKRGDFAAARNKLAESERLEPAVGTELNLALCEEQLHHLLQAWQLLQLVAEKLSPTDVRVAIVRDHFAQLDARLARVTLTSLAPLPPGAEIRFGSTRLTASSLGVPIPLDPGLTRFIVVAPGYAQRLFAVKLRETDHEMLEVSAGPPELAINSPGSKTPTFVAAGKSGRTVAVLSAGVGASLLGVGAVAGIGVLRAKTQVRSECDDTRACSGDGLKAAERGAMLSTVSTAAFATGLACVGLSVWLIARTNESHDQKRAMAALSFRGNGVTLEGRFR